MYLAPPVTALAGSAVGGLAWAVMTLTYVPMLRYYRMPLWRALALPATAALYLLMTLDSARRHHRGRGAAWKGRTYAGEVAAERVSLPPALRRPLSRAGGIAPASLAARASTACPSRRRASTVRCGLLPRCVTR